MIMLWSNEHNSMVNQSLVLLKIIAPSKLFKAAKTVQYHEFWWSVEARLKPANQ